MITLYLKTHNKTGLKYLGKTVVDPFKYKGSGVYWSNHLKKHGNDVSTDILFESESKEEITEKGLYYSTEWNIVESKEFANLIDETGSGGDTSMHFTDESRRKISESTSSFVRDQAWRDAKSKQTKEQLANETPEEKAAKNKKQSTSMIGKNVGSKSKNFGKKWWNNGTENRLSIVQPDGFELGRLQWMNKK